MPYPKTGMGYRKPSMPRGRARGEDSAMSSASASPFHEATLLLESGLCIWCESAPASEGSHLCRSCRADDPDGVLGPPTAVATPAG